MIEMHDLTFSINEKVILENLTLQVAPKMLTCIMGPNGAGKSTALRILAGLENPSYGECSYQNNPLQEISRACKSNLFSFMDSEMHVSVPIRVEEFLTLAKIVKDNSTEATFYLDDFTNQVWEKLDLSLWSNRFLHQLSSGEKQRCFFALAMLQKTFFTFLDEPVSHMDPRYASLCLDLVKHLCRKGLGAVVVLHDINQILQYADQVFALKHGKIFFAGKPGDVLNSKNLNSLYDTDNYSIFSLEDGGAVVYQSRRRGVLED
ncbi:ABC transporter ATP-binding protein [Candidatus Riflebacteria bacterium]